MDAAPLRGGWTSRTRRPEADGPGGRRSLVLRSFVEPFLVRPALLRTARPSPYVEPFSVRHAEGPLSHEVDVLRLPGRTGVPAAGPVAVE